MPDHAQEPQFGAVPAHDVILVRARCSACHGSGCDPRVCSDPLCTDYRHKPCPTCDALGWVP